eukprot:5733033-Pleurochrysis_carterae.AAC.1
MAAARHVIKAHGRTRTHWPVQASILSSTRARRARCPQASVSAACLRVWHVAARAARRRARLRPPRGEARARNALA